jgi:hypothetical protein
MSNNAIGCAHLVFTQTSELDPNLVTVERIAGIVNQSVVTFPTPSINKNLHIVKFDESTVIYKFNGSSWITVFTIETPTPKIITLVNPVGAGLNINNPSGWIASKFPSTPSLDTGNGLFTFTLQGTLPNQYIDEVTVTKSGLYEIYWNTGSNTGGVVDTDVYRASITINDLSSAGAPLVSTNAEQNGIGDYVEGLSYFYSDYFNLAAGDKIKHKYHTLGPNGVPYSIKLGIRYIG